MSTIRTFSLPYRRLPPQRGSGIGSFFSRIASPLLRTVFKTAKPMLGKVGKSLARQGISAATNTLSDIIDGQDPKTALRENAVRSINSLAGQGKRALSEVISDAPRKRRKRTKRTKQKGSGFARRRQPRRKKATKRRKSTKKRKFVAGKGTKRKGLSRRGIVASYKRAFA